MDATSSRVPQPRPESPVEGQESDDDDKTRLDNGGRGVSDDMGGGELTRDESDRDYILSETGDESDDSYSIDSDEISSDNGSSPTVWLTFRYVRDFPSIIHNRHLFLQPKGSASRRMVGASNPLHFLFSQPYCQLLLPLLQ